MNCHTIQAYPLGDKAAVEVISGAKTVHEGNFEVMEGIESRGSVDDSCDDESVTG